jgi:hypothetical protein
VTPDILKKCAAFSPVGSAVREKRHVWNVAQLTQWCSGFGGLLVNMLASGTQDRRFEPSRSSRIFRAKIEVEHLWRWRAELKAVHRGHAAYRPGCNRVVAPWPRPQSISTYTQWCRVTPQQTKILTVQLMSVQLWVAMDDTHSTAQKHINVSYIYGRTLDCEHNPF